MKVLIAFLICVGLPVAAQDVLVIGEVHDNPAHHAAQAERVAEFRPSAVVFEMLTPDQAALVTPEVLHDPEQLKADLDWVHSGWPEFEMYYPVFRATEGAVVIGAGLNRGAAHAAMSGGFDAPMQGEAEKYGLTQPLPPEQQAEREALQMSAHCDALPEDMLPGMVKVQRLRDAMLARAVVEAKAQTGGAVIVITGNGHARRDWGMPAILARVAPDLEVRVIGQTEDDNPLRGAFDEVLSAPAAEREDPCAAFSK